jgi:hypothetical protein
MSQTTAYPCLKVDVNGTEILPKKFAKINWDNDVLDNDIRDDIREKEEEKRTKEEEDFESRYEEYYSDEDDEEEEEEEDEYAESPVPHSVLMEYIKTLGQYGYADMDKLGRLSPEDWDDLAANVGIEPDHEKHLLAALGIKRPKKVRRLFFFACILTHKLLKFFFSMGANTNMFIIRIKTASSEI